MTKRSKTASGSSPVAVPLYTGLVTARPPKEVASKAVYSCLQDLSARNPTLHVPQGSHEVSQRERHILLWDQALTPPDMPGCFGLEPWAIDTARLLRAKQRAEREGTLPSVSDDVWKDPVMKRRIAEATKRDPEGATVQGRANLTRIGAACGMPGTLADHSAPIESWDDVLSFAEKLMRDQERQGEAPRPQPQPEGDQYKPRGKKQKAKTQAMDGGQQPGEQPESAPSEFKPSDSPPPQETPSPSQQQRDAKRPQETRTDHSAPSLEEKIRESAKETSIRCLYDPAMDDDERMKYESTDPWHIGSTPKVKAGLGEYGIMRMGPDGRKPIELTMRPRRRVGGVRKAMFEGSFCKKPHRLYLDGKVFSGPVTRGRGGKGRGTVLVDLSGSMSWTEETLSAVLDAMPECTILGYCGSHEFGGLCTLAERGRTATMESIKEFKKKFRAGNCVDGPALQYLAQSSGPRVWFSDGAVTGRGDSSYENLHHVAEALCLSGRIFRTEDIDEATAFLAGSY